jgi:hypothetical protein
MIEAIKQGQGVSRVKVICDDCGKHEIVACAYHRPSKTAPREPDEGQARKKVEGMGWAYVKGVLRCASCEAKRKAKNKVTEVIKKPNVQPIRKADSKQKRLIILALEDAYDDAEKRYRGGSTDRTVAEELGGGIMPGWVAEVREELYGPAGNEEADQLRADIDALQKETARLIDAFKSEQHKKIEELRSRLDDVVQAHDKRVGA